MKPISLVPDRFGVRREAAQALFRSAVAQYLAVASRQHVREIAKTHWPNDRLLTRAAVTPLVMSDLGIAGISDLPVIIAPNSAFAALSALGIVVDISGVTQKTIPNRIVSASDAGAFFAEASAIPVQQATILAGPTIAPYKLGVIRVITRELAEASVQDCETILADLFTGSATMRLDSTALGNAAAVTGVQPAGILNGVSAAGTAKTGGGVSALAGDVETLMTALATNGGGVSPIFVCHPAQAASMKTLVGLRFDYPIIASVGVTAGTVIAIEGPSFVSAFAGVPEFSVSTQAVLHMDTAAGPVSTVASPNVISAPTRSIYQSDLIAVKMILRCSWAMRASGHVQFISSVSW